MKSKLLFLYFLLIFNQIILAQSTNENIIIEDYSYKNGLKTSCIYNAYEDNKGFLWLCTMEGLFRFDGFTFRNINTIVKDTFNIKTNCISEDNQGNFWIGTMGKGIYYYNTHTERILPVKLSNGNVASIFQILFFQKKIWIATNIGLLVIDQDTYNISNTIQTSLLLPNPADKMAKDNSINTLLNIKDNNSIWVGSHGSLFELDIQTLKFNKINSQQQNSIRCLSKYKKDLIIAGAYEGGIFGVNTTNNRIYNDEFIAYVNSIINNARIIDIYIDKNGRFWLATYGEGLYLFNRNDVKKFSYTHYKNDNTKESLKSDLINRMYVDKSGIVWLCMNQPALSKLYFQINNIHTYHLDKENVVNEILTFNQSYDNLKLWIATINKGIYLFNTQNKTAIQYSNNSKSVLKLQNNSISICYQDSKGNLWIVDRHAGLFIVPAVEAIPLTKGKKTGTIHPIDANKLLLPSYDGPYITKFYEDREGRIWLSVWESLYVVELMQGFSRAKDISSLISQSHVSCVYSKENNVKTNFPIVPIRSFLEIKKHQYLIGTSDIGIIELDEISPNNFSGILWKNNNLLPGNIINCLYRDKRNGIWIGTNSGLSYYSTATEKIKTISLGYGIDAESINNIIEDDKSNIWVSYSYGISKIHPDDFSIVNFFHPDRANLNQYIPNVAAHTYEGVIYFSSKENLAAIDPNAVQSEADICQLYFTDIKLDNLKVIPNEKYFGTKVIETNINECKIIHVPYNHTLNIEFAALDFKSPERHFYKYRVGNKKEWIILNPNQRNLNLPAMSPGDYTLEIMHTNHVNEDMVRKINIHFLPPFWQSKAAFAIYFVILVLLFLFYRRITIQKIQKDTIIEKERYEKKKLQELDLMKSEFFSNISHEFRTPLSLIINPLEKVFNSTDIPDKNREKLNLVLKSSYRLLKLTNELMDFSKIEKKLLVPEFSLCELITFVTDICSHYNNLADSMNIDFKVSCPFEKLTIPIDVRMIEKVIYNLLSNAFKYTPENGIIMVNLTKNQQDDGTNYIKISIINTGEGIKKEIIDKIFDKYYQANNLQNHKTEGTGIGLALVKSYVELHNGQVNVKSEPDQETCFDVYLPLNQNNYQYNNDKEIISHAILPNFHVSVTEKKTEKSSSHYSLLIVEDDDEIRNYIKEELSIDFKIITAGNGEEGLELANKIIPDIIITDIVMPVFSGIELCKALKTQVLTSHIPLVLLSAKTTISQKIEGLETGADVYITKPFSIDYLRAQVNRLLNFKEAIYLRYLKENTLLPKESITSELDKEFMQKIIAYIEEKIADTNLDVEQLAKHVNLSHAHTYRKIRAISGMSVVKFIRTVRLKKAVRLVAEKQLNFTEIAYETGFSSLSYFTHCFHEHFGKSPSDFASGIT